MNALNRIKRRLMHMRLQPIHVYCLHHVCTQFYSDSMHQGDWMALDEFKYRVLAMQQQGIVFISLSEAYKKMQQDAFRINKYAVLTFDDGYASLKEILPWLIEQNIPATLFINPDYANGIAYRETPQETYLNIAEIENYVTISKGLIEIGMHGLQHKDVTMMSEAECRAFVLKSKAATSQLNGYIPFWAYTWGRHTATTDKILHENSIIPVLMDGMKNFNDIDILHRELLM